MKTTKEKAFGCILVVLMLSIATFVYAVDPSLVAYWPLDENKGDKVNDASGNGNNGKIFGKANWVKGKFGSALEFDGKENYIEISEQGERLAKIGSSSFAVLAWVNTKVGNMIVSRGSWGWNGGWYFHCRETGKISVEVSDQEGDGANVTSKGTIFGGWTHVAMIRSDKDILIHINGVDDEAPIVSSGGAGADVAKIGDASNDLLTWIGKYHQPGLPVFFTGVIDEVAIYDKALTKEEIQKTMEGISAVEPMKKLATTWARIKEAL